MKDVLNMNLRLKMIIENQKKIKNKHFFPLNQQSNFQINKFFESFQEIKK